MFTMNLALNAQAQGCKHMEKRKRCKYPTVIRVRGVDQCLSMSQSEIMHLHDDSVKVHTKALTDMT